MSRNNQLGLEEALLAQNNVPANQAFMQQHRQRQRQLLPRTVHEELVSELLSDHMLGHVALQDMVGPVTVGWNPPMNEQAHLHALENEIARLQNDLAEAQRAALPPLPRGFYVEATPAAQPPAQIVHVIDPEDHRGPAFDVQTLKQVTGIDE
jgi:hypothetical protein